MKKSLVLVALFLACMNIAYLQTPGGSGKDTLPDCKAVFQYYYNDSIRLFAEAYPYQFNDLSVGDVVEREWDFGDGNTSSETNPLYFYQNSGDTVTVCLTITTSNACQSSFCRTFVVGYPFIEPDCNAYFYMYPDSTVNSLCYKFQPVSNDGTLSWHWDFGDGTESYDESPLHHFPGDGMYTVCLIRMKPDSLSCTYCQQVYSGGDTIPTDCYTSYEIQTLESYPPQYRFVPYSSDSIDWYYWDFGDGQQSYEMIPVHKYEYSGFYTICLTTKTINGCKSNYCTTVYSEGASRDCKARWEGYPADWVAMSSVLPPDSFPYGPSNSYIFYDYSSGKPVSWHWTFGDGTESYEQNPFHTFPGTGIYSVCLEILTADSCTSRFCDSVFVGILEPCSLFGTVVDYTGLDACGLIIQLDNGQMLEPQEIIPEFQLKAGQRVKLSYSELPNYASVCMVGKIVRIDCIEEIPQCSATFTHYALPWVSSLPPIYQFDCDSSQEVRSWQWDFGDGNMVFEKSPRHRYDVSGYYTVCLTVTTVDGCSGTYCESSYFEGLYSQPGLCDYRLSLNTEMIVGPVYSCEGSASIKLINAMGNEAEAQSYWWSTGSTGNFVDGLCTNMEYQVAAIDPDGCYITGSFIFNGGAIPYDTLWGNWKYEKVGMDFIFSLPVFQEGFNCVWEFGDGSVSQGSNVSHTYTEDGEFIVVLKLYDTEGNIAYTREITVNTIAPVGIPDHSESPINIVYPVPAKDQLYIALFSDASQHATLEVYNPSGQQVLSKEINTPAGPVTVALDIADLPAGAYYGLIKSGTGGNIPFRFIK
jgi:PKD repeat protein